MVEVISSVLDKASGRGVPETARRLFGNVKLEFGSSHARGSEIVSAPLGRSRFTRLKAESHLVIGGDLVPGDCRKDAVKVMIQLRGRAELAQGRRRVAMEPDALIFYDPALPYEIENRDPVDVLMLHMPRETIGSLDGPLQVSLRSRGLPSVLLSMMETASEEMAHLDRTARESLGRTMLELIKGILAGRDTTVRPSDPMELLFARIKHYVADNFRNPALSAAEIAKHMGCSPRYVYLAFETQGITPAAYIWQERLKGAAEALSLSPVRAGAVTDIAYEYGFSSSAHFSRLFREHFACSPTQWMKAEA